MNLLPSDPMYLHEIQEQYNKATENYYILEDRIEYVTDELDICIIVLRAIAKGECKDYPPEDFAAEVLKVFNRKINI